MRDNAFRRASGGRIDRSRPIEFTFNGRPYTGYEGDTLASALIANGVSLTARSFKYHRPRGIIGAGVEEPASLVELRGADQSGNQQITTVRLKPGLCARSVNCWPSPGFDLMAINQLFSRLLPAAFYYKTFMWPNWQLFEPFIRKAAGLAGAPEDGKTTDRNETRHLHCDILIVGAGPCGLIAALTAARAGARVVLADDGVEAGGSLLGLDTRIDGRPARHWIAATCAELDRCPNVTRLSDALVWAYREHDLVLVTERSPDIAALRQRTWRIRAKQVLVAAGAIERPLVFPGNDRPGIMLASAVRTYVNRYAVLPGRRAVIVANNSSAYGAAADMRAAGIDVSAIVDCRARIGDAERALAPGIEILTGHHVAAAHGGRRVRGVTVTPVAGGPGRRFECDLLCLSGGWSPTVHLFSHSRGRLRYDDLRAAFLPDTPAQNAICIGAADGHFTMREALASGAETTVRTLKTLGFSAVPDTLPSADPEPAYAIEPHWPTQADSQTDTCFVDYLNDVTLADVHLAMREGFGAVEHVKRYTTAGMGLDQGKTGNINVIGAIARQSGIPMQDVGATTFRAPYAPVEFGAIAGLRQDSVILPYRHTPMTRWHKQHGAVMYEAGARWRRPGLYPGPGESFQETVNRESLAVRETAGVYDGSPLGKFEIKGRDALKFIEMLYTNSFANLETGMGRYGLMLSDDGLIFDDGVGFKLGENHYLLSTSTGHADAVNRHMEHFLQIERPHWQVMLTPVTAQWSNATLCGPKARDILQSLGVDFDVSNAAFPFMALRAGTVAGLSARICRVSFTGELSFEINVASRHGLELWEKVMAAGKPFGLQAIGSEANHVLRVEKGFLSLGHEADGTVDAHDLGMGWILSKRKPDHIGKRAVEIRRSKPGPRRELVGLLIDDPDRLVPEGAPLTPGGRRERSEGLVTACVWSVMRQRAVALALLVDGRSRIGDKAHIRLKEEVITAEIVRPCFHDPDGALLRS